MTTPRAWPTANAERAFWPKKTSSTATAEGLCSAIRSQSARVDPRQAPLERLGWPVR